MLAREVLPWLGQTHRREALVEERVKLQDQNGELINKKTTITKAKEELQNKLATIEGKESEAKKNWEDLVAKFAFKPKELNL